MEFGKQAITGFDANQEIKAIAVSPTKDVVMVGGKSRKALKLIA